MKIKFYIIPVVFCLLMNLVSVNAQEYKRASGFTRVTTNALGYNFVAKRVAQGVVKRALQKNSTGEYKVTFDSFSGVDLKRGMFKGLTITGKDIVVDDMLYVSSLEMKTTSDFNYVQYNKKPMVFVTDVPMAYKVDITESDLNKMLKTSKFYKSLMEDLPLIKVEKLGITLNEDKITFTSFVRFPFCKPMKCSVSSGVKVNNGKVVFENIDTGSLSSEISTRILNIMNDWNFLSNLNLYLFDGADTVLEVQTIKIDNEKIHISGNLTLNKAN